MRRLFRSLPLAVRRYFAKPVAFRVSPDSKQSLFIFKGGVTTRPSLTYLVERYISQTLQVGHSYIVTNHEIAGAKSLTEVDRTGTKIMYLDEKDCLLSLCTKGLTQYFPVLPKTIWIKEDGSSW